MGVVPPAEGFLEFLREATRDAGALLVFDEVITGFRVAAGGAQQLYGVDPDLTVFGKVLGGGLPPRPSGAGERRWRGSRPLATSTRPDAVGQPAAVAAGLATLRAARRRRYERLAALTERLAPASPSWPRTVPCGLPRRPASDALLRAEPVTDFSSAAAATSTPMPALPCLLDRGVYPPPSQFEAWFVSLAHDEDTVDRTLAAAADSLAEALA